MKLAFVLSLTLLSPGISPTQLPAREWTDSTGRYTLEAKLVAYNDRMAVLQRADHELGAFPLDQLSKRDRDFVKAQQAPEQAQKQISKPQIWTLRGDTKVIGSIVDYANRDITLQRRRGRIYVNDRVLENLPEFYQRLVPQIVSHSENLQRSDRQSLEAWFIRQRGQQRTFHVDGVIFELENGDEFALPFFLFSEEDQQLLQPGWKDWLAAHKADNVNAREDNAFLLQSWAAARQRDAQVRREIAMAQLRLQAVQAGLTSLWEVTLHPGAGQGGRSQWVVVQGRNSRDATENALRQHPGYIVGPIRRVAG